MTPADIRAAIARTAAQQHGLVRRDQLPAADTRQIRRLVQLGELDRLAVDVFRVPGAPETWLQRVTAAAWALGPTAVISHRSAARLYEFERFEADDVELTVLRAHRDRVVRATDAVVHSTTYRAARDTRRIAGLPVTSPERTILDLARHGTPKPRLEAAIDSAVRLRLTTLDRIVERASDLRGAGRWGLGQLDVLLLDSGGTTLLERRFLQLVRLAGLPIPTPQVVHRHRGRHVARVDFLFEPCGVVVEVSGGRGHSSPSERAKDARRRNELQRLGRLVLEFTYEQVTQQPDLVVATLRAALVERRNV